ncbi:hypothetical protein DVH05_009639, partial [Phytophthora capsici]
MEGNGDPPKGRPPRVPPDRHETQEKRTAGLKGSVVEPEREPQDAPTGQDNQQILEGKKPMKLESRADPSYNAQDAQGIEMETAIIAGTGRANEEKQDTPIEENHLQYDDEEAEALTFVEMYSFLVDQIKDQTMEQALEAEKETAFMQELFEMIFEQHPDDFLPPGRRRYPQLEDEELELLYKLFILDLKEGHMDSRKWKGRLQTVTRAIYKSRSSLSETLEVLVKSVQAKPAPATNPWSKRLFTEQPNEEKEDVEMVEGQPSIYRFLQSAYSAEQIVELRQTCETRYGFPSHLRKPTAKESTIIRGLLEGTILCPRLPDFLKRICNPQAYRKIQNTIKAQVEGDLLLKLHPEFKIYPQFQTRKRLTHEFLRGVNTSGNDPAKVTAMLQEAKQICYDQGQHAVHLFFWTREMATKWSKEFSLLSFRNRKFPLRNVHDDEQTTPVENDQRSKIVWSRQVGADGIKNELARDRYHVRLLNLSRFLDESAIDAYIQQNFEGIYHTWQEPTTAGQIPQTDTWDIFFRSGYCPTFLNGIRFINWDGTKILVHHVSRNASSPCFSCGATGHMRTVCTVSDTFWKTQYCLTVSATDIEQLPQQQSTITSLEELETLWEEVPGEKNQSEETYEQRPPSPQRKIHNTQEVPKEPMGKPNGTQMEWSTVGPKRSTTGEQRVQEGGPAREAGGTTGRVNKDSCEWSQPPADPTKQKKERRIETQEQKGENTQGDEEELNPIGRTITEEIQKITRQSSSGMTKQRGLIFKLAVEKQQKVDKMVHDTCLHINAATYPNESVSGEQVLQDCGLEEMETPGTGNCQYYAVATTVLQ